MRPGWRTIMLAAVFSTAASAHAADDLPPVGRSRFDQLIGAGPVPYPFPRLVERINAQMRPDPGGLPALKVTLIPLGRSLQRDAGAPDFFRFPRVVAAADGDNRPGYAPLKDRLFLGFHEKGEVVEVISYNETAGRFEFQIVHDYKPGATPQVFYARRSLCLACHQNAAPIFARPLWDETPANPEIARRLKAARAGFYKVKMTGTDIAYFIDSAADRANLFAVWQRLWREGCGQGEAGDRCRRDAFAAALDYLRTRTLPGPDSLPALSRNWKTVWPSGLAIPNPDLQNRDPLAALPDPGDDPLLPRPPLEVWHAPDPTAFVVGLAGMLDAHLARRLPSDTLAAALDRLRERGELSARPFGQAQLDALAVELGVMRARSAARLPPPRAENRPGRQTAFHTQCGVCHDSAANEPPNFLHGDAAGVDASLDHCAERIFYRLSMARTAPVKRGKSPMPPSAILTARGTDAETWARSPELDGLLRDIRLRLRTRGADPDALLAKPYAQLRVCLPPARP